MASIHRGENIDNKESLAIIIGSLNAAAQKYRMPIIVSTHPRTQKSIEKYGLKAHRLINFHKPLGYFDYVNLQKNAFCVLSDSGTILEESSILQFPAVQVRSSSERPEAYDEGVAILSGLDRDIILQSIEIVTRQFALGERFNTPKDYQNLNVSSKVLRLVVGLSKIIQKRREIPRGIPQ